MFNNLRITTAQQFVLHSLLSLLAGALASGLAAAGLAISQPNVNTNIVIGAGVAAFSAWFVHGLVSLRNSPQFAQAESDALAQAQADIKALGDSHLHLLDAFNSLYQQYQQAMQPKPVATPQALQGIPPLNAANTTATITPSFMPQQQPFPQAPTPLQRNFGTQTGIPVVQAQQ